MIIKRPTYCCVVLILLASFLSGCSSSSDSTPIEQGVVIGTDDVASLTEGVGSEGLTQGESTINEDAPNAANTPSTGDTLNPGANETVVTDPLIQNATQVHFNITVPAYKSNALQVRLSWGEFEQTANWIGDELWSTTAELPTNTEHVLTVMFFDNNGDIELGSFEQNFKTGFNAAESYQVSADLFDIDRWDTDGDGVSNLNELLAGNDPLIDESQSLEIRDQLPLVTRESVPNLRIYSGIHEAIVPGERPYFDDTRIQWTSTLSRFSLEASCWQRRQFKSETRRLNDRTMSQEGFQVHRNFCSTSTRVLYDTTYTLTGVVIEDSSLCEATAGKVTVDSFTFGNLTKVSTWEFSKEPNDIYWTANGLNSEGQLTEEFLVPIDLEFYCDFSDL